MKVSSFLGTGLRELTPALRLGGACSVGTVIEVRSIIRKEPFLMSKLIYLRAAASRRSPGA